MSKPDSGLFDNTFAKKVESTAAVWEHIHATQDNYPGTKLPRSFVIDTLAGELWVHGNATKHMYDEIFGTSTKSNAPMIKNSNPDLYTQFILYDFYESLNRGTKSEIRYGRAITVGNWEFVLAKPRESGKFPVIKHAQFLGWGHEGGML